MTPVWERHLNRWTDAGVLDSSVAARVRAYESQRQQSAGLRWPVLLAIGLGALLLGAGVLLFVAAHWDGLSPAQRFGLLLATLGLLHGAAAVSAGRFAPLSTALHAVGTICLGGGIFLAGQIFNLEEHWPSGILLWAIGAAIAWAMLRDWPQAALVAILVPAWISSEWIDATGTLAGSDKLLGEGVLLLSISYLTGNVRGKETAVRGALVWIGGLVLIPATAFVASTSSFGLERQGLPASYSVMGWAAAFALPLAVAVVLRGRTSWINALAAIWIFALGATGAHWARPGVAATDVLWGELASYGLCALGSLGLIAWGMKEVRKERVNLGVAGFAITVMSFYFSTVMDKLDRSASLIGLGVLFLLGGWLLEKTRRRLVARLELKP